MRHAAVVAVAAVLLISLAVVSQQVAADAMSRSAKCSACQAFTRELARALAKEKPRKTMDLRNVLKPDGSRDGKVIDYAISEMRAIELMEKACDSMDDYTLTIHNGNQYYTKVKNNDGPLEIKGDIHLGAEGAFELNNLKLYCGHISETHEEWITNLIRTSEPGKYLDALYLELCENIMQVCPEDVPVNAPPKKKKIFKRKKVKKTKPAQPAGDNIADRLAAQDDDDDNNDEL